MSARAVPSALPSLAAALLASAALACAAPAAAQVAAPPHGVVGVADDHLRPEFWIRRLAEPDRVLLTTAEIAAQNARMSAEDPSFHDLARLPDVMAGAEVRGRVERLSRPPSRQLWDERGQPVPEARIAELAAALALDAIPAESPVRFGLVTRRADLRTFPTRQRVFSAVGSTDIDRWQESALFPGAPVAIVHASRDGAWWFVVSATYAAWVERESVAEGPREQVLAYARRAPHVVVTGAKARTVFTPERPAVSELELDMGVRLPLLTDWPADSLVNGQHPYTAHVVQLPERSAQGRLELVAALLPRTADVSEGFLPLTQAGILRQAFKFLGERYGWGHAYDGRDCSGFVSEVYRAFGVEMPRNTGDQAVTPVLSRRAFAETDGREARLAALREARAGDLVYVPGHVMMVVGRVGDVTYVIHDVVGIDHLDAQGRPVRVVLNGVSVTPLEPLAASPERTWVDGIRAIQRVGP